MGNRGQEIESLNWEWYAPSDDSLSVNFCLDTSLHGLQYLGQRKRHLCERLFWFGAVAAAVGAAGYLIWNMYAGNRDMPIITVFSPTEKTIDEIPFPAVTICNVNNLQKSKHAEAKRKAIEAVLGPFPRAEANHEIYAKFLDMYYICDAGNTFTSKFVENDGLGIPKEAGDILKSIVFNETKDFERLVNPRKTLAENSQSCQEMILYCLWQGEIADCNKLFQEVETDYGYCCTFNLIPVSLLAGYGWVAKQILFENDPRDDPDRVAAWKKEKLSYDNILFTDKTMDRKYPRRQLYPGREAGLSVFLDPDLEEYKCTNTDSQGFVVLLNSPIDFPRIKDSGISIPNGTEVFINIRPQITMTDKSVEGFSLEKRNCYFGEEYKLPHYTKYTTSNCMDECIANRTKERCSCVRYYMPHDDEKDKICRATDYKCVDDVRKKIYQEGLGKACNLCLPTCTEIDYQSESTFLRVIDSQVERMFNRSFGDLIAQHVFKKRQTLHHPSIVHLYFGVDSTYPRLRTESSSITQLISNAGGILGLCLGFSVLSVLEIIYFLTLRVGCNWYRDRAVEEKRNEKILSMIHHNNATLLKMQMSTNVMRMREAGLAQAGNFNPGIPGSDIHTRYNTLFK